MPGPVFISYTHGPDSAYVEKLATHLTDGEVTVWFDRELVTAEHWSNVTREKLYACAALVVVMSPEAEASDWVGREIDEAQRLGKTILPLLLRGERFDSLDAVGFDDVRNDRMPPSDFVDQLRKLQRPTYFLPPSDESATPSFVLVDAPATADSELSPVTVTPAPPAVPTCAPDESAAPLTAPAEVSPTPPVESTAPVTTAVDEAPATPASRSVATPAVVALPLGGPAVDAPAVDGPTAGGRRRLLTALGLTAGTVAVGGGLWWLDQDRAPGVGSPTAGPTATGGQPSPPASPAPSVSPRPAFPAAAEGTQRWRFSAEDAFRYSSPVVAGDTIYVGNRDYHLYAINVLTGEARWKLETSAAVSSTPAVGNSVVIAGGRDGWIFAADRADGKVRWKVQTGAEVRSISATVDGVVFVAGWDHKVRALSIADGGEKWAFESSDRISAPIALVNDLIVVGDHDGYLYGIHQSDGTQSWREPTGGPVTAGAQLHTDGVLYHIASGGSLAARDPKTGMALWRKTVTSGQFITVSGDTIYVSCQTPSNLRAVSTADGTQRWSYPTGGAIDQPATVDGDTVYVGSRGGYLHAVNRLDGRRRWRYDTGPIESCTAAVAYQTVFVGGYETNELYAISTGQA